MLYYLVGVFWMYGILKPIMGHSFYIHRMAVGVAIKGSGIVIGLLAGALLHWKFLGKLGQ